MSDLPAGADLRRARLLGGITVAQLARLVGVVGATVDRMEKGDPAVKRDTIRLAMLKFSYAGIKFEGPGLVTLNGRRAPNPTAVGQMTGARLRAARTALRVPVMDLTMATGVRRTTINKLEVLADCTEGVDQRSYFAVFGELEHRGYRFGRIERTDGLVHPRCVKCVQLHPADEPCAPATA